MLDRRTVLGAAAFLAASALVAPLPASALTAAEATRFVEDTAARIIELLKAQADAAAKAAALRRLMEERAALPEIARFAAGPAWRTMSEEQRRRFVDAFAGFIARTYADRFADYTSVGPPDEVFRVRGTMDLGAKGILVKTEVVQVGAQPVAVDWLVRERGGRLVIADLVIEGVSMVVTKRDEIAAMLEARRGDVEKLIADLRTA